MHIVIKKSDQSILEVSDISPPLTNTQILDAMISRYGGLSTDYSVYQTTDQAIIKKVLAGKSYNLVLDVQGNLTGLDFSVEDNKLWLNFSIDKPMILANELDTATLTISVRKADDSGIKLNYQGTDNIPIAFGDRQLWLNVTFVNGVATYPIQASKAWSGNYQFPDPNWNLGGFRLKKDDKLKIRIADMNLV